MTPEEFLKEFTLSDEVVAPVTGALAKRGRPKGSRNKGTPAEVSTDEAAFLAAVVALVDTWQGPDRPVLYDWECRDQILALKVQYGIAQ